jgi:transcriptional regulator with XRE-family HTH domain
MGTQQANLLPMETVGEEIQRRRQRLGIDRQPFAREADVSPTTVRKLEEGKVVPRDKSLAKIRDTLDRLEAEAGIDVEGVVVRPLGDPRLGLMEVEVEGRGGFRIVVRGPVDNPQAVVAAARELMEPLSTPPEDDQPDD